MAKWADFGIFRVKRGRDQLAIIEVEAKPDLGDNFGAPRTTARQTVVSAIEAGTTYVTVYIRDGKYTKGEDVQVVTVLGQKYLRTDRNAIRADNLGALPEYA